MQPQLVEEEGTGSEASRFTGVGRKDREPGRSSRLLPGRQPRDGSAGRPGVSRAGQSRPSGGPVAPPPEREGGAGQRALWPIGSQDRGCGPPISAEPRPPLLAGENAAAAGRRHVTAPVLSRGAASGAARAQANRRPASRAT